METLIAEQPLLTSIMLGVMAAGLIYGWMQTGKKEAAWAGLGFALLIPVAWVVATIWETDRERIESLIYEVAAAIENNDHARALEFIGDEGIRSRAEQELKNWTFHLARVNRLRRIDVIEGTFPPEADVEMSVKVRVSSTRGSIQNVPAPRRIMLKLQKFDDDWLVSDYRHSPLVGPPDRYSTVVAQ